MCLIPKYSTGLTMTMTATTQTRKSGNAECSSSASCQFYYWRHVARQSVAPLYSTQKGGCVITMIFPSTIDGTGLTLDLKKKKKKKKRQKESFSIYTTLAKFFGESIIVLKFTSYLPPHLSPSPVPASNH